MPKARYFATTAVLLSLAIASICRTPVGAVECNSSTVQEARRGGGSATGEISETKNCVATVSTSTPEQRWAAYCEQFGAWRPTNTVNLIKGEEVADRAKVNIGDATQPVTGISTTKSYRWAVQCDGPAGFNEYSMIVPEGEAPVDPVTVRNHALAKLNIPDPALGGSPPLDDPDRFSVVRIPTWLWITHDWEPLTASATDGGVSVSVTATPTHVSWDPGDGQPTFDCPDAGKAWKKGMPESAMTCGHTYTRSSAGQPDDAYQLVATVNWSLTWSVNGVDQGQFDTYQPVQAITHQVGEILSVSS